MPHQLDYLFCTFGKTQGRGVLERSTGQELVIDRPRATEITVIDRPLCLGDTSQQLYALQFKEVKKLDTGGPVTVKALEDGNVQVAELFTGSSVIPKDAVLLKDDKGLQGADNPVVLIKDSKNTPQLDATLNKVSAKITTAQYRKMTLAVQNQKQDPADVAKTFLKNNKLA
jgi:glycine betaine/choline ABC-type transport system substrate-binding protein